MKKKKAKKLEISKETLRNLEGQQLQDAKGATVATVNSRCLCTTNASHCTA